MILLMLAAILGGGATVLLLWPLGDWIALLCAPLGGSVFALAAAAYLATQPYEDEEIEGEDAEIGPEVEEIRASPTEDAPTEPVSRST
ncbi:hypothetical protein [Methylobacterium nigriterrae]|uniref:hypothetical protein n=1 Tax=Methylobacterium nigriterrae TaxID=3127512 RepID=UPI003013764D